MRIAGYRSWQERADVVMAQGCNTYSKRNSSYVRGVYETHCVSGEGNTITLADGNKMIDHTCGLGSNILSCHNNFGLPTTSEVVLAENLLEKFPFVQKWRFLKTGTSAVDAAIRIARASFKAHNKDLPAVGYGNGYHGCGNVTIAAETPGAGCVDEGYKKFSTHLDLIDALEKTKKNTVAYVIIEPVSLDVSKEVAEQVAKIRTLCTEKGVVLIFDEIITGFRVPLFCIANYFRVAPDILLIGKALGNGHPIAAVGGRSDLMDVDGWFISNTHNGELSSISAALEVVGSVTDDRIQELWRKGSGFIEAFNKIAPDRIKLRGYPTRAVWVGDKTYISIFCQEAYRRGILLHPGAWWISFAHDDSTLKMELKIFKELIDNIEVRNIQLGGLVPSPVFDRVAK